MIYFKAFFPTKTVSIKSSAMCNHLFWKLKNWKIKQATCSKIYLTTQYKTQTYILLKLINNGKKANFHIVDWFYFMHI